MDIQQLTAKVVEAVKTRETYHCDSTEYEEADKKVYCLINQIPGKDLEEFNKLFNQPENWKGYDTDGMERWKNK